MTDTGVDFTDVKWTQLATLYLRARDARSRTPILGDQEAVAAMSRIDYDFDQPRLRAIAGERIMVALRARTLDAWASEYLAQHPDAVVVQLGCGLDSRVLRLGRPPGNRWFDIDLPEVIELRRRLYDDDEGYRMLGYSVTDPAWLDEIPAGGPVLVIAEGLLMYLAPDDVATLLHRIAGHVGSGRVLADGLGPWAVWSSGKLPGYRMFTMRWAMRPGDALARLDPAYRTVRTRRLISLHAEIPHPGYRWLYRAMDAVPRLRDTVLLAAADVG